MRARTVLVLTVAAAALALPAGAAANHHWMVISEVHPETTPGGNTGFVELQMYSAGQNVVTGRRIDFFDSTGTEVGFVEFATDPPNAQNQRTILVGDTAVNGADLSYPGLDADLNRTGGAVCFDSEVFMLVDCVGWGAFSGSATLPVGNPAPVIEVGRSLTRSIAPGCATLLEGSDDTDDSAIDFGLASPTPRPNAVTPTEQACTGGGPGDDTDPPQTKIRKPPKGKIGKDTVKVKFKSDEPDSSFECKLDRKGYKPCRSPRKLKRLDDGRHKFSVRATDAAGNTDPSPAKAKFRVVT
jgi:hypothetical protein